MESSILNEMGNLFIAIKLEAAPRLIKLVRNTQVLMRKERIRWIPDVELNVKLADINVSGTDDLKGVIAKLNGLVEGMPTFSTNIRGFGNMGSHLLSAGVEQNSDFLTLRQKLNEALVDYKEPDQIDFVPNILLARINSLVDKRLFFKLVDANRMIEFDELQVKEVCLMSSELNAYGPVVSVKESFQLEEQFIEEAV